MTDISLKEFLLAIMDERDRKYEAKFAAAREAVLKAEAATERRFESVNEFRQQMADMQASLVRKGEVDIRFEAMEKRLDAVAMQLQAHRGQDRGMGIAWGAGLALLGLLVAIAGLVVKFRTCG
ncbi:MAG: hypothetical protein PHQ40_20830 [Anaerolineaceae bacterium]|nr:hypothetical protein [Anaerolineaceae bacterium]